MQELFSKFGSLTKNKIFFDELGRSEAINSFIPLNIQGTAIIEYEKPESAEKAINEYHGM